LSVVPKRAFERLRRSVAASPRRTDAVLAAVFAVVSVAQVLIFPIAPRAIGVAFALVATLPIAFRHVHPVAAALVSFIPWAYPTDGYLVLGYVVTFLMLTRWPSRSTTCASWSRSRSSPWRSRSGR
jgi:hypothetical protein